MVLCSNMKNIYQVEIFEKLKEILKNIILDLMLLESYLVDLKYSELLLDIDKAPELGVKLNNDNVWIN